jgi:SAM-dependent methyltransferase
MDPVAGIYADPELYEAACAYRDVPADVDALLGWWKAHGTGDRPGSVLEMAAGPAEHARELARRGTEATALDLSPAMCAWAADRAAQAGTELTVVRADMRGFDLGRPFDLAITMLNSLCHLLTLDDMVAHLGAVARHVAPGGLYVIELAHPADCLSAQPRTSSDWVTDTGNGTVSVSWGGPRDRIDPISQVTQEHVKVSYRKHDGGTRTISDVVPNRFWTATEMEASIRLAGGFGVAGRYGDFDSGTGLDAPGAWRMILVLRPA